MPNNYCPQIAPQSYQDLHFGNPTEFIINSNFAPIVHENKKKTSQSKPGDSQFYPRQIPNGTDQLPVDPATGNAPSKPLNVSAKAQNAPTNFWSENLQGDAGLPTSDMDQL